MGEVVGTVLRGDGRQGGGNGRLQAGDGPDDGLPEERLELGKRLLNRIEIRRIRRQEDQAGSRLLNGRPGWSLGGRVRGAVGVAARAAVRLKVDIAPLLGRSVQGGHCSIELGK